MIVPVSTPKAAAITPDDDAEMSEASSIDAGQPFYDTVQSQGNVVSTASLAGETLVGTVEVAIGEDSTFAGTTVNGEAITHEVSAGAPKLDATARIEEWMFMAAVNGDTPAAKSLLHHGANPRLADARGWTPLHTAAYKGDISVAKALVDAAAFEEQEPPTLARGLEYLDNDGRSPLMTAVRSGKSKFALFLLDQGASVDIQDYHGMAPIFHALMYNDEEVIRELVRRRCYLGYSDHYGSNVLHIAANFGKEASICAFTESIMGLPSGSLPNVNGRDEHGRTPLKLANARLESTEGNPYSLETFEQLIKWIESHRERSPSSVDWESALLFMLAGASILEIGIDSQFWEHGSLDFHPRFVNFYPWYIGLLLWLISSLWCCFLINALSSSYVIRRLRSAVRGGYRRSVPEGRIRVSWVCVSLLA